MSDGSGAQGGECRRSAGDRYSAQAPAGGVVLEDLSVGGVVVDDQGLQSLEGGDGGGGTAAIGAAGLFFEPDGEPEGGAFAGRAANTDLPFHQVDDLFADGEAESCPAEPASGRTIRLGEGAE